MEMVRDWEAEKKDLQEAFDIIADKLVKADQKIDRLTQENANLAAELESAEYDLNKLAGWLRETCDVIESEGLSPVLCVESQASENIADGFKKWWAEHKEARRA